MKLSEAIKHQFKEKLFVSLALKPGNTGSQFYNTLFDHYQINAEYVACECTNIDKDLELAKSTTAGISVTMPYKTKVRKFVDTWYCDPIGPVNTLKITNKQADAYNTDFLGLEKLLTGVVNYKTVAILGDGAMSANAETICLAKNAKILKYSRNKNNWSQRHASCDVLINCTSIGVDPTETPVDYVNFTDVIIDCVISNNKLVSMARQFNKQLITGAEIYKSQFLQQFEIYTGIKPDEIIVDRVFKNIFTYV